MVSANYGVLFTSVEWSVYCMGDDILAPYIACYRSPQVTSHDGLVNATYYHSLVECALVRDGVGPICR